MEGAPKKNLKLKLGNLALAIWLATVPTVITYGVFGLYGIAVCNELSQRPNITLQKNIDKACNEAVWDTASNYIFLIGFFITLPTWYWFYMSMKKKRSL